MGDHKSSNESGTRPEIVREMMPYALYAAAPIIITLIIAYTFGSR